LNLPPSLTGLISGVELEAIPEQLSIGGFSPFQIRGRVVRRKRKKKGVVVKSARRKTKVRKRKKSR